jgi:hypothetical protein
MPGFCEGGSGKARLSSELPPSGDHVWTLDWRAAPAGPQSTPRYPPGNEGSIRSSVPLVIPGYIAAAVALED